MKQFTFLILLFVIILSCNNSPLNNKPDADNLNKYIGIYTYEYEHNTMDLNENHYIIISNHNNVIKGFYYGTSDDFDEAREGYLPGFFVKEMNNLVINNNKISFTLDLKYEECFSKPVPIGFTNFSQLPKNKYKKWNPGGISFSPRDYTGIVYNDRIELDINTKQRIFYKNIKWK